MAHASVPCQLRQGLCPQYKFPFLLPKVLEFFPTVPLPLYGLKFFLGGLFDRNVLHAELVPEHSILFRSPGLLVKFPNTPALWLHKRLMERVQFAPNHRKDPSINAETEYHNRW